MPSLLYYHSTQNLHFSSLQIFGKSMRSKELTLLWISIRQGMQTDSNKGKRLYPKEAKCDGERATAVLEYLDNPGHRFWVLVNELSSGSGSPEHQVQVSRWKSKGSQFQQIGELWTWKAFSQGVQTQPGMQNYAKQQVGVQCFLLQLQEQHCSGFTPTSGVCFLQ